ncbi:hypothetical protein PG994_000755 [Apiospora phragmitis]|uniref:Uncharacterized protein n=1 Tax=Apiospora phragmitis TaxID=2905665 RepID=A0ABR1X742_9PEZI
MPADRAVAILGLQERLARAFRTEAAYGMFSLYFARGLLWRRASEEPMTQIAWPSDHSVPSWSWVSKLGPISYLPLEFEKVAWAVGHVFDNPLKSLGKLYGDGGSPRAKAKSEKEAVLHCYVKRLLTLTEAQERIKFDIEGTYDFEKLHCMEVGRDKPGAFNDEPNLYVLVVYPSNDRDRGAYERVGVATLKESELDSEESWVDIR